MFRRDPNQVKEQIRGFMLQNHISQSTIARETGGAISQSYISQWLSTTGQEISDTKKRSLYVWYILERKRCSDKNYARSLVKSQLTSSELVATFFF